jgi:hypothetical protein
VVGVWETFRGNEWGNRGVEKFRVAGDTGSKEDVVVDVKVMGRKGFYEARQTCMCPLSLRFCCFAIDVLMLSTVSPLSLLKNPMILLALVALGFTFGMPKLMENSTYFPLLLCPAISPRFLPCIYCPQNYLVIYTNVVQWIPKCAPNSKNNPGPHRSQEPRARWRAVALETLISRGGWLARLREVRPPFLVLVLVRRAQGSKEAVQGGGEHEHEHEHERMLLRLRVRILRLGRCVFGWMVMCMRYRWNS